MGIYTTRRDLEREVSGRVRSYCQTDEDAGRLAEWIERLTAAAWAGGVRSETTLDEWLGYATGGRCARLDALAIDADSEDDGERMPGGAHITEAGLAVEGIDWTGIDDRQPAGDKS